MNKMNILISGAGPAGLTVAYWLKKYGFTPVIVERGATLRMGGYKIDVRGAALEVLKKMGIYEAVVAANTDMQGAKLVDKQGEVINEMSGDTFGHRVGPDQEIMRGTLCQILLNAIPDVEIIFGDFIQALSQTEKGVWVEFKNNKPRLFDLVIGADGLHSNIRELVFGEEARFSQEFGIYLCVYTIPNFLKLDRMEIQYTELGRMAAIWSTRGETTARVSFAFVSKNPVDLRDIKAQQTLVKAVFSDIGWEVPKFLQFMSEAPDFYFDVAAQIRMKPWFSDRVVLLGDAAYCASPMSGQGTSLALIGAYVLAGELLLAKGNHRQGFNQYEQEMRPFVAVNQELGAKAATLFKSQEKGNVLSWLLMKLMHFAPGKMVEFFIDRSTRRIQRAANAIDLKDYDYKA